MNTCKDCIHFYICLETNGSLSFESKGMGNDCRCFKDALKFIELPCFPGDTVWTTIYNQVYKAEVDLVRPFVFKDRIEYRGNVIVTMEDPFFDDGRLLKQDTFVIFGEYTFLTREEAEKKLEEMKNEKERT